MDLMEAISPGEAPFSDDSSLCQIDTQNSQYMLDMGVNGKLLRDNHSGSCTFYKRKMGDSLTGSQLDSPGREQVLGPKGVMCFSGHGSPYFNCTLQDTASPMGNRKGDKC